MTEFNYRKKIKELFKEVEYKYVDFLKELVLEAHDEFIRLLKHDIMFEKFPLAKGRLYKLIDKRAGDLK